MASTKDQHSIAILDDYASIADANFASIPGLKVTSYPKTLDPKNPSDLESLVSRLESHDIISTMRERTPMPASLLSRLPKLKLLLTTGVRNASLDLNYCKEHGIIVGGTTGSRPAAYDSDGNPILSAEDVAKPPPPGYDSTTQHAWSLVLSLTSRIPLDDHAVKSDSQAWQSGFSVPLGGRTLGVVGLGKLGTSFARIGALGFGMKVVAWSENLDQEKADAAAEKAGLGKGVIRAVGKEELFSTADVVSLHYVLSERSKGVVGRKELQAMKKTALLVNTSRGPLIDEEALLETLEKGGIRGVGLDVYWQEPLPADSKWRSTKWGQNGKSMVVLSPHMGYVNEATMSSWYAEQAESVKKWINGEEMGTRLV